MQPNYAIAILSYNHPELTAKTVQSVLDYGFPADQIVLTHNGSEEKFVTRLQHEFSLIQHNILKVNKGFSGGANAALTATFKLNEKVLFLTNDTEVLTLPENFSEEFEFFSILIKKRNSENIDSLMGAINLKTGHLQHIKNRDEIPSASSTVKSYIPGTAFGISQTAFEKLEGFDESLHTYWEDVDLSLRAHKSQLSFGLDSRFQIKHKIGKTCHKHRFYTLYLYQRNRKRIMSKYGVSPVRFSVNYHYDMAKLFFKVLSQPEPKKNLTLWWKAFYDKNI